jgi:hypothetical protein
MAMSNVSVHEQEIAWEDFATVKVHKKQLQKHSKKKELSAARYARNGCVMIAETITVRE